MADHGIRGSFHPCDRAGELIRPPILIDKTNPAPPQINGGKNVQVLLQYQFPAGYGGKTCRFSFANPQKATGSKKAQLFTVGGPVTATNTYWSRPYRDQYLGTFNAGGGTAEAAWDEVSPPTRPCPAVATTLNYEVVPQNDKYVSLSLFFFTPGLLLMLPSDYISWYIGSLVIQAY